MNINSSMVCRLKSTEFCDVNGKTGGRTPLIVSNIDNLVSRKSNIETKNYPLVGDTKSISDFSAIENSESSRYLQKNEFVKKYNFNHDNYKYKLNGGGDRLLRSILSITSQNPYWITGSVGCKTNGDELSSHLSDGTIKKIKLRFSNSLLKIISGPDLEKIIPKERLNTIREPQAYKIFERVLFNKSLEIFDLSLKGAIRIMSDMLSINLDKKLISSNSFKEIECRYEADFCSQFGINIYFDVNSSSKIMTDSIIKDDNGCYSFIVLKNHYAKSKEEYITVVDKLLNPIRGNLKEYCSYIWGDNKESEASDNRDMSNDLVMRTAPKRSKRRSMRSEKWNGLKSDKMNEKLWKDIIDHSNNEQASGTAPWLRHFDCSEMMPRNYLFGKEDAKSAFLELFFGFSKDVELCSSFDSSFELGKIAQSVKHSIYKSSPTNNEGVNEINKHSTGEIVEKNKRIKKMIEETREEKERHGCNWICFPSAESSEISEPSDYVTPEEYEQNLHREKRRAPGNAKPENYLNLDIEKVYSGESNLEFLELKDILSRRVGNDIQSQEDHTWDVVKEINRLRRRGSNVDQFLRDALDLYVMRRLDTDPEVGTAYSYFQHRTREELVNHGRLYVDSDLENFTMGSLQRMHHDPETGVSNRIDFLTAKMFIAQANGESIHPQHLGLALGDISIYRQIMKHNLEQRYENKIQILFSELENSRSSSRVMDNVDNALGQTNVKTNYKPVLASYTDLASQATPITYKAQGYCHYYAVSAALAMSENDFQDIIGHVRKEIIAQNPEDPRIKDPQNVGRLSTVLDRTGDIKLLLKEVTLRVFIDF